MSIRVLADGADGFALLSPRGELVGWVRGRAIGVAGFGDEPAAIEAAVRSNRVLSEWLERNGLPALASFPDATPSVVHDGAHRWILSRGVPVARLPEPAPTSGDDSLAHAFEIVLRGIVNEGMSIHAALIALRAARGDIDANHIRWPIERGEPFSGPSRRAS
jgi:hypothetical protein